LDTNIGKLFRRSLWGPGNRLRGAQHFIVMGTGAKRRGSSRRKKKILARELVRWRSRMGGEGFGTMQAARRGTE